MVTRVVLNKVFGVIRLFFRFVHQEDAAKKFDNCVGSLYVIFVIGGNQSKTGNL